MGILESCCAKGRTPEELIQLIHRAKEPILDQWEVQILARILMKADIYLFSTLLRGRSPSGTCQTLQGHWSAGSRDYIEQILQIREISPLGWPFYRKGPQTVPFIPLTEGKSV